MTTRTAIITGGSRGIGRQITEELHAYGHNVVIGYVSDEAAAQGTIDALTGPGSPAVVAVRGDIADSSYVRRLFATATEHFGGVDVVVNAAGIIGAHARVAEYDLDELDRIVSTNIRGTFVIAQYSARELRDGGAFVTVSSSATRYSRVGSAAYTMSKSAVEALSLVLARELRGRDITVNTVAPGVIGTELFERFLAGRPEDRAELIASSPLERLGRPDDIASVVAFLAGKGGRWINGQTIFVNGGGI